MIFAHGICRAKLIGARCVRESELRTITETCEDPRCGRSRGFYKLDGKWETQGKFGIGKFEIVSWGVGNVGTSGKRDIERLAHQNFATCTFFIKVDRSPLPLRTLATHRPGKMKTIDSTASMTRQEVGNSGSWQYKNLGIRRIGKLGGWATRRLHVALSMNIDRSALCSRILAIHRARVK